MAMAKNTTKLGRVSTLPDILCLDFKNKSC